MAEISRYTSEGPCHPAYRSAPTYSYQHFGDPAVLMPLQAKLDEEYAEYNSQWQHAYVAAQGGLPQETLEEMAVVSTVYGNLKNSTQCYPQEYMAALAEESYPLLVLSDAYQKAGFFAIEPQVRDLLGMIAGYDGGKIVQRALDPAYAAAAGHIGRMALLDRNLDREAAQHDGPALLAMGYEKVREKAVEIFTLRQLYRSLRFEKARYPAAQLEVLAMFQDPLHLDKARIVGERDICQDTLDEINSLLPQLYPLVTPAPDIWSESTGLEHSHENGAEVLQDETQSPVMGM